ncbi:MAG: hypothetical protein Q9162_003093 [Coniocarpon cinnabarinum]
MAGHQDPRVEPGLPKHHHHYHLPHYHLRKTGKRLGQLIHPANGRRIHIAQTPAEADVLRKTASDSDEDVEICIHGSDEHVEALNSIRAHHDEQRSELREKYGHIFEQVEAVSLELEALSEELKMVTDRSVQFDANLNRFGYSAAIRTHGNTSNPRSSSVSLSSGRTGQQALDEFHALKFQGQAMKPWRKPILRQYFHKGVLWRASEEEQTASYELFLDLIYVGIIAVNGDNAAEEANGSAMLRFSLTFTMGWKIWFDVTQICNWIDQDDIWRRLFILVELACLVGFTTNITEYAHGTYVPLISYYIAARLFTAIYILIISIAIPMVRWTNRFHLITILIPIALWIGSAYVPYPQDEILIWIAIAIDLFGTMGIVIFQRCLRRYKLSSNWFEKAFEFFPAQNIEHRIDRTGAFVTLVFGYSIVSLLYLNADHIGLNAFLGKALLSLVQAFSLNTLYFEIDSFNLHMHAIRRSSHTAMLWMTMHLPMILAFVLAGAALSRIVLTDDVSGTSIEDLAEYSQARSEPEIGSGLRWFYTAGLGMGMLFMNIIALTHEYRDNQNRPGAKYPLLFKRPSRLVYRSLVGLALIFLGHDDVEVIKEREKEVEEVATELERKATRLKAEAAGIDGLG